jgi:methylmalonyl-CoA mutase
MQKLFSEFSPSSISDWKKKFLNDIKESTFESYIWQNENGFDIEPFYNSESLSHSYLPAFTHSNWDVCVSSGSSDSKSLNSELLNQLARGANSISINCSNINLVQALDGILLNYIQSTFYIDNQSASSLFNYLSDHYNLNELNISILPILFNNENDLKNWANNKSLFNGFDGIKTIGVNLYLSHNQNCLAYYEIALIFSALVEQLEFLSKKEQISTSKIVIKTGVNSDYFIQIAKLRAIRRLWNNLKIVYNCNNDIHLIVETTLTNKSISDSYNNLIRSTIESMAAIAGGCNELIVSEFDSLIPTDKILSERLAVNQQLILKDESYFDKIADVSCGSYYIESITDAIASKALETFKRFENEGGYFKCIEKSIFFNEINIQAKHQQDKINNQEEVSVGVNRFKNELENLEFSQNQIESLSNMCINNPGLNFELNNYLKS